jgi:hypothetical protein
MDDRIDRQIAAAARRRGGHVTRRQLLALGLTSRQIDSRIERGWLIPVYRGVYAVGHRPVLPVDRAHGALLAAGPKAVLSHRSAASLWKLVNDWRFPFEVTTTDDRRVNGITIHRSKTLHRRDITTQLGIRTTTIARTIFDLAPSLTDRELERMIDSALHGPYMKLEQLHELISRLPGTAAARRLRALLTPGYRPTRSELERLYRRWCHDYGVPLGIINYRRNGRELDAYYPEHKLIVELDSLEYHADPKTFNGDRRKDREQLAEGLATVRLTWEALRVDPAGEAELFQSILAQRSGRSG